MDMEKLLIKEISSAADFVLGTINFLIFACIGMLLIGSYYDISSDQSAIRTTGIQYAQIIFFGSFGLFMESICSKLLQAKGNMIVPMLAQVAGALINIVLDPILIFGLFGATELGTAGAAIATVAGQWTAMLITLIAVFKVCDIRGKVRFKHCVLICQNGLPSVIMQSLYTLYIIGLNLTSNNSQKTLLPSWAFITSCRPFSLFR